MISRDLSYFFAGHRGMESWRSVTLTWGGWLSRGIVELKGVDDGGGGNRKQRDGAPGNGGRTIRPKDAAASVPGGCSSWLLRLTKPSSQLLPFSYARTEGKFPDQKVQKSMMWPGSERFQAWLPNQEDVAYDSGLGFGLLCSMFPLMAATGSKQQILETSQADGK